MRQTVNVVCDAVASVLRTKNSLNPKAMLAVEIDHGHVETENFAVEFLQSEILECEIECQTFHFGAHAAAARLPGVKCPCRPLVKRVDIRESYDSNRDARFVHAH